MSEKKDTGGPAFPVADPFLVHKPKNTDEAERLASGMTLRDYFAANALQPLVSGINWDHLRGTGDELIALWAKSSYVLADAMLKARGEA